MFHKNTVMLCLVGITFLLTPIITSAEQYDKALRGVSTAKVYFDVNIGAAKKLVTRLMLIDKTYTQLIESGVKPEFIVGFRGKASRFATKGKHYVFEEDIKSKQKVHDWIKHLSDKGISVEQCKIAAGFQEIAQEDFLAEVKLVQNGYLSMIGYQTKGYAQIPMD